MIVEFLIFAVLIVVLFLWRRFQQMQLRQRLGIPGPKTNLIFGNLHQVIAAAKKYPDHAMMIAHEWRKQYGSYFGYYFGPRLTVSVVDLDLAKDILIKQFDCFVDRIHFVLLNKNTAGSVMHAEGDKWKQIRSAVSPIFTASKMKQMSTVIHDKIDTMIAKLDVYSEQAKTFDIYDVFQALTLDVIGQCAFGVNVNCQNDPQDQFLVHCQQFFKNAGLNKSKLLLLAIFFPELGPILKQFNKLTGAGAHENWLIDILKKVVQERKKTYKNHKVIDILQLLFEQKEENKLKLSNGTMEDKDIVMQITDDVIVGNAFVFLLAGYETTSTALAYTAWLLAKHRDVQEKLQREIDEKVSPNDTVNYDLVHKLPYLDAVFRESLRIFPPVIQFTTRTCIKECDVGPIHFVPGMEANFPVRDYHWNPDFWPEPEKFDPERFLNNSYSSYIAWMPFGIGPRNCIGMRFADMEFKMALVCILQKFNIVFGPESEDPLQTIENFILLRPKNGVQLRVVKRSK